MKLLTISILSIFTFFLLSTPIFANQISQDDIEKSMPEQERIFFEEYEKNKEYVETERENLENSYSEFENRIEQVKNIEIDEKEERGFKLVISTILIFIAGIIFIDGVFTLVGVLISIFFGILTIALLAFNILMIIDCHKREFKDQKTWMIILLVSFLMCIGLIPALIYYFAIVRK